MDSLERFTKLGGRCCHGALHTADLLWAANVFKEMVSDVTESLVGGLGAPEHAVNHSWCCDFCFGARQANTQQRGYSAKYNILQRV